MITSTQPFLTARHGCFPTDVDSLKEALGTEVALLAEGGSFEEGGFFNEGDGLRGLFVEGDGLRGLFVEGDGLVDESCAIDSSFSAQKVNRAAESADCFGSLRTVGLETGLEGVLD